MFQLKKDFKFAFLNNEGHALGRMILQRLYADGYVPSLMIEERSPFALMKTTAYDRYLEGQPLPPTSFALAARCDTPRILVSSLNGSECEENLQANDFDLIVLGNARILKKKIFSNARHGCINVHPGLLPDVRGAFPQCWSILEDRPVGCTCHLLDDGVDTGPIIMRREIQVVRGDSLADVVAKTGYISVKLMADSFAEICGRGVELLHQSEIDSELHHWPEPALVDEARHRLANRQYSHFVDT